ncbi:hypothetical protein WJX84_003425 [Apatococcus fuscideae]|uniref:Fungal lipase-type domain-containing protein n=1 Tax=Apatococcus fuscideae TaxID=2026836 RepID=A0AAW1T796_9CHLO
MATNTKAFLKNVALLAAVPLQEGANLAHELRHAKVCQEEKKLRKQASEKPESLREELLSDTDFLTIETPRGLIKRCALESFEAYHQKPVGFRSRTRASHERMHLNFWEGSRTVFIAFKGTEGLTDTVMDLMVVNKNAHGVDSQVTVHTGFKLIWEGLRAVLVDENQPIGRALKNLLNPNLPMKNSRATVICTGHSLGGAVATLCASWLKQREPNALVYCVTFGSPRVGSAAFADLYHRDVGLDRHYRVVNKADPVSKMPSSKGYHHVGTEIAQPKGSQTIVSNATLEGKAIPAECLLDGSVLFHTGDHSLSAYVNWLFNNPFAPNLCSPFTDGPLKLISMPDPLGPEAMKASQIVNAANGLIGAILRK